MSLYNIRLELTSFNNLPKTLDLKQNKKKKLFQFQKASNLKKNVIKRPSFDNEFRIEYGEIDFFFLIIYFNVSS